MEHHKPSTSLFDVYLRLRPSNTADRDRFLDVEQPAAAPGDSEQPAPTHITIKPPADDYRKRAVEKFAFTRVFEEDAGQRELFDETGVLGMVEGVLGAPAREGRDGLVATLGVTGSGKSHTILGSKSTRGLTQLILDVLFQHTAPYLAAVESDGTIFPSLCQADVSEAQLLPADHFLDAVYCDNRGHSLSRAATPARGMTPARGATPALVRDPTQPVSRMPGAFPNLGDSIASDRPSTVPVFERLYPSLASFQNRHLPRHSVPKSPSNVFLKNLSPFKHLTRSIAKLTSSQETSFVSAPSSRRHLRLSDLPHGPSVEDVALDIDTSAEYAVVISMYEVYNDRIFDLLNPHSTTSNPNKATPSKRRALLFKPTEHSPDRKVVAGLRKLVCSSLEEALLVLETGLTERRVAGTGSNATSSRSHGFFCLEVKKRHRSSSGPGVRGAWTGSALTIVDLAGSERARAAKTAGSTLAEAGKINESLMYLGQCMQMQSDISSTTGGGSTPALVPFRQCKLTELLFSNSLSPGHAHLKAPQKSIMIVTADPLGDFNATSQILRYSALAREVTVPRIPSVTASFLAQGASGITASAAEGRTTPSVMQEELERALSCIVHLRADLEVTQLRLEEETSRRRAAEASWRATEQRIEEVEAEVREEVWGEFEAQLALEQRRWRAARAEELDNQDLHMDRKLEVLMKGIEVYEDEEAEKENIAILSAGEVACGKVAKLERSVSGLEMENAQLKERLASREREQGLRSPSKKVRVLKARRWEGSGMGLEDV